MEYDPNNVEFGINGVTVDEGIMNELKKAVKSEFLFIMSMIDSGVINDDTGINSVHNEERFTISIEINIK